MDMNDEGWFGSTEKNYFTTSAETLISYCRPALRRSWGQGSGHYPSTLRPLLLPLLLPLMQRQMQPRPQPPEGEYDTMIRKRHDNADAETHKFRIILLKEQPDT